MRNILVVISLFMGINTVAAYELADHFFTELKVGSTFYLEELSKYDKFKDGFYISKEPDSKSFYLAKLDAGTVKILGYDKKEQFVGITAPWIKVELQGRDQVYQGYIWAGHLIKNIQLNPNLNTSFVVEMEDTNMVLLAIDGSGKNEGKVIGKITESLEGKNMVLSQMITRRTDFDVGDALLEVTSSHSAYDFAEYTYYYLWQDNRLIKLLSATEEGVGECGSYLEKITTAPKGIIVKTIQVDPDNCNKENATSTLSFNTILYQWNDQQKKLIEKTQTR